MSATPAHEDTVLLRASALKELEVIAGIDRGCTLTKVAFLPKDVDMDAEFLPLRCLTFTNAQFEDALHVMKANAKLPTSGKLHVTGVGCDVYSDKIKEILGLDVHFMNEVLTLAPGVFLTITNTKPDHAFHPTPSYTKWTIDNKWMTEVLGTKEALDTEDKSLFPACVVYIGSGGGRFVINEDGKFKPGSITSFSGKVFMGLANLVLGTTDYHEIMTLAAKGDRTKVDNVVKDVTESRDMPNIGKFPSDMPTFAFGKAASSSWKRNDVSREDLAASILCFFAAGLALEIRTVATNKKVKRFFFTGNFIRAEIVRSKILEASNILPPTLDIRFSTTGHSGAIGAMLLKEDSTVADWSIQ